MSARSYARCVEANHSTRKYHLCLRDLAHRFSMGPSNRGKAPRADHLTPRAWRFAYSTRQNYINDGPLQLARQPPKLQRQRMAAAAVLSG